MTASATPHILLVHGSWLGGWCWQPIRRQLEARGFETSAPDLRGMGEPGGKPAGHIGLTEHVEGLREHLASIDADRIVLVGHSYGAAVAAEAAALEPGRITAFVNLDGFITRRGQSLYEGYPALKAVADQLTVPDEPDLIAPPPADLFGLPPSEETQALMERLCHTPHRANTDPARFDANDLPCRRIYIRFDQFPVFAETVSQAARDGWETSVLGMGHMGIVTDAEIVADHVIKALR